jgi:hypothetical protein
LSKSGALREKSGTGLFRPRVAQFGFGSGLI